VKEVVKRDVIVGIDPGFIKMGVAVINAKDGSLIRTECV